MTSVRGIAIGMAAAWLIGSAPAAAQTTPQVLATGLDNPRGLAVGPDDAVYVAESGRGGTSTLCRPAPTPPFAPSCTGATGAITRVATSGPAAPQRVITGLPSAAVASGNEATGPSDIDFGFGSAWVTMGWGGDPAGRAAVTSGPVRFGSLVNISFTGVITDVLDLAGHEASANPDGGAVDSNPFGLDVTTTGAVYADAGANAVMRIAPTGAITTLAALPTRTVPGPGGPTPAQSVPTTVVTGPNGDVYVGELTGFPFATGEARVYRIPAAGGAPVVVAEGFTMIIDIAVDARGNAYVLEYDANGLLNAGNDGRLTRIGPFGERTVMASAGLPHPGGVAIGADGAAYVTINSDLAGSGGVVRVAP
jgi:hypothetical protein